MILIKFMSVGLSNLNKHKHKRRYKGMFRSQEVAIKVFKTDSLNGDMQQEFAQEVYILRLNSKSFQNYKFPRGMYFSIHHYLETRTRKKK